MNKTEQNASNLSGTVIDRIHAENRSRRPRTYFLMKGLLAVTGALFLILASVYLVSLVFFITEGQGHRVFAESGVRGAWFYIRELPWLLILLALGLLMATEVLVHRFGFAYRQPVLLSVLVIVGLTAYASVFVVPQGIHERTLMSGPALVKKPIVSEMCEHYDLGNVVAGTIATVTAERIDIMTRTGETITLERTNATRVSRRLESGMGNEVLVLTDVNRDGATTAISIVPAPPVTFDVPELCALRASSTRSDAGPWGRGMRGEGQGERNGTGSRTIK